MEIIAMTGPGFRKWIGLFVLFSAYVCTSVNLDAQTPADTAKPSRMPGVRFDTMPSPDFVSSYYITEAKLKFNKRIWHRIDIRNPQNLVFSNGNYPMSQYLWELIQSGKVQAYRTDSFASRCSKAEVQKAGEHSVKTVVYTQGTNEDISGMKDTSYLDKAQWRDIQKWDVMEEFFFDAEKGVMVPVIIGLAPVYSLADPGGVKTDQQLFWVKMEDLKPYLLAKPALDRAGEPLKLNWYDLLNTYRLFDAYIIKENNPGDRYLNSGAMGDQSPLSLLLQDESIRNDLFIFEHDLWEY